MQAIHNSHLAAKHAKTEWVARHEQRLQALSVELRRSVHEQQSTSASRPARGTNPRRSGALYADFAQQVLQDWGDQLLEEAVKARSSHLSTPNANPASQCFRTQRQRRASASGCTFHGVPSLSRQRGLLRPGICAQVKVTFTTGERHTPMAPQSHQI